MVFSIASCLGIHKTSSTTDVKDDGFLQGKIELPYSFFTFAPHGSL
jgi:hypothetical protein